MRGGKDGFAESSNSALARDNASGLYLDAKLIRAHGGGGGDSMRSGRRQLGRVLSRSAGSTLECDFSSAALSRSRRLFERRSQAQAADAERADGRSSNVCAFGDGDAAERQADAEDCGSSR